MENPDYFCPKCKAPLLHKLKDFWPSYEYECKSCGNKWNIQRATGAFVVDDWGL